MPNKNSLLVAREQIGAIGGFVLALCITATYNFAQIFYENFKAASASGMHTTPDGYEIPVCYFGPPVGFYPRFFVFLLLFVSCLGVFKKNMRGRIVALLGVVSALSAYIYWWIDSYKAFKSFNSFDIDFLNHPEIRQTAYLYNGSWLDVCVAVSLLVVSILLMEKISALVTRSAQ
ncbi:MAG: hypothetical protein H0W76_26140 [Pyrinomonadaceae bacterium]|nr:hypothetical protein [Pyrinomonadaceae bacterium]